MCWYAVYTRSRFEDRVYTGLVRRSVKAFLPKTEVWSRRKDRRKKIFIPLFSGYLFVEFPEYTHEKKLDVLTTPGVVKMLDQPNSSEPMPVPEFEIDAVRRLIASGKEIAPCAYPGVGERARITDGLLKDIEGLVVRADYQKNRFVVSIEMLQRSVSVTMDGFRIEKI